VARNHELKDSDPVEFDEALKNVTKRIMNIVTHNFLVVIISDFYRYSAQTLKSISILAQHNDVILAKIMDPLERDIPDTSFIAGDRRHQITIAGKSSALRQKFKSGFEEDVVNFEAEMLKHRIPLVMLNTVHPVDQQLRDVFTKNK
jgi:hypothetical protein